MTGERKNIFKIVKQILFAGFVVLCGMQPLTVSAAEGEVTFGSESYHWDYQKSEPIGVYVKADAVIDSYELCLQFDPTVLEYVDGASRCEGDKIYILSAGTSDSYHHMLHFKTLREGNTTIQVVSADCVTTVVQEEPDDTISGSDKPETKITQEQITMTKLAAAPIRIGSKKPTNEVVSLSMTPVTVSDFRPEVHEYSVTVAEDVEQVEITCVPENDKAVVTVSDTALQFGENRITVSVRGTRDNEADNIYTILVTREEPQATPEPTMEPTPEPTAEPTEEPQVTAEPAARPAAGTPKKNNGLPLSTILLLIAALVVALLLVAFGVITMIRGRNFEANSKHSGHNDENDEFNYDEDDTEESIDFNDL